LDWDSCWAKTNIGHKKNIRRKKLKRGKDFLLAEMSSFVADLSSYTIIIICAIAKPGYASVVCGAELPVSAVTINSAHILLHFASVGALRAVFPGITLIIILAIALPCHALLCC
jgi:hypothetical protein